MPSLLPGYEYDVFISYRQKDNKGEGWVSGFVDALKAELDSTFKENISLYFDANPHDGLSDHHDVDLSLQQKIKALIFIPVISQTYCDPSSFAWKNEFLPFLDFASRDSFGLKVNVANGNVANRILPVRIHELDPADVLVLEKELGGMMRAIDFTFHSNGINRPLKRSDSQEINHKKTTYTDQINKVANAIKEIVAAMQKGVSRPVTLLAKLFPGSSTLPTPVTTLFGRSQELDELTELLRHHRVVSIIGTGGMGKTRLALELARRIREEFSGNVGVASLASLTAPEEVIPAVANLLGIKEAEGRDLTKTIASIIGDQKALLVLDNMEQVIGAAPSVAGLSLNCPNLKILTTSRTPLKISAEYEYALRPLPLPAAENSESADQVMEFPSVSLFVERARKVKSAFALTDENASDIVQICRRLDGLPLALELAAARVRVMSARQLLQRLGHSLDVLTTGSKDLPERHQTLRATIDWSHSLLNDTEKQLFRRMSVFSGGCTLDAIEQTCYNGDFSSSVNELESLVDKGLVQPSGSSDRFIMLETLREFAFEKLNDAGEHTDFKFRHSDYFLNVAQRVDDGLEDKRQLDAMRLGIEEESNINSALDFLLAESKEGSARAIEKGLQICGHLHFFWHIRCKHILARQYSNSFLALPNCPESGIAKCWCLATVGLASFTLGKLEQSVKEYQAAYDIALALDNRRARAFLRLGQLLACIGLGKIEEASRYQEEFMQLALDVGTDFYIGFAHASGAIIHLMKGEPEKARAGYERALPIHQRIQEREGSGLSLGGLALLASMRGEFSGAIELYRLALRGYTEIGDRAEEARIWEEMAWVFLKTKDVTEARSHFLMSIRAYEDIGSVRGMGQALMGIAGIESVNGNPAKAIKIATAAQLFTEQEGIVNSYGEGFQGKVYLDEARSLLSNEELDLAIVSGKRLSLRETLQLAGS